MVKAVDFISLMETGSLKPMEEDDKNIISDLRQHKELIPFKGVLGGTPDYSYLNMHIGLAIMRVMLLLAPMMVILVGICFSSIQLQKTTP